MKNTLLIALLIASLGLNVWFAVAHTGARAEFSAAEKSDGTAGAGSKPSAGRNAEELARPFVWKGSVSSDAEVRSLVADLRAAGFPPAVIARIVGVTLRDRAYAKVAELPYWKLIATTREVRKAQIEASRELQRLQQELLGAAGSELALLDPMQRRDRFGDLGDDKVASLLQIERDYQEVTADLVPNGVMTPEESKALQEQFKTLEKERLADIKAALGPEAYAEYERQNSGNAMAVLRGLRELQVSEEEYNALFAAQKARSPDDASVVFFSSADPQALSATYAFNEQVRAILGEERAHTYLKSADPNYRRVAQFTEQQSLPPATAYQLYQLQNEAQLAMQQMRPPANSEDGNLASGDIAKARQALADLNTRLETLLGAEKANAYRTQGSGSIFRTFAPRPAPAGTTPAGTGI
ncbi:MAG TPA: hypothetical protein VK477_00645, partial [Acidobacteriota bacterium]|nr:hypothetical protein [Acidobacteriota bacterium]